MTPERKARIEEVCAARQPDLAVILENVHDPHNISAVLRSCDAVGVQDIYVAYTEPQLTEERLRLGRKSSASAWKWVDVHYFTDLKQCLDAARNKYRRILAVHLGDQTRPVYDVDLSQPVALLFGNEHSGVSEKAAALSDGQIDIPQYGMIKSLNISVACAVTLYEALRQRRAAGMYDPVRSRDENALQTLVNDFVARHESRPRRKSVPRKPAT